MKRGTVESSFLKEVGYKDGILEVEFTDGTVFQYDSVPFSVFRNLVRAESKGEYFNLRIKDKFEGEEV